MSENLGNIIVSVSQLCKRVPSPAGELTLLDGVEFNIRAQGAVAIVGASGSGKSTLLGLLAGLDTPTSGRVVVDGHDLFALDEERRATLRGALMGFVFQTFQLLPHLSALENVMLPLELAHRRDAEEVALTVLSRVGLYERVKHYPKQLSGGEQQRVAIARAFAMAPRLLLADEPTGSLDKVTGEKIIELLFQLNREHHTTLVLVTHDDKLAVRCDRKLVIDAGRLIADADV